MENKYEAFMKLHNDVIDLMDEINEKNETIMRLNAKIERLKDAIHTTQVDIASKSYNNMKDVEKAGIPVDTLCRIFSLNAGICDEALEILQMREKEEKRKETEKCES